MKKKRNMLLFTAALCLSLLVGATGSISAQTPIPWFDYDPPESFYMGLDATGSYHYLNDEFGETAINRGSLRLRFVQFMDSPTFGYDINASVALNTKESDEDKAIDLDFFSGGHTSAKYYFMEDNDIFGYGGITGSAASAADGYSVLGTAGVGYGRFKDVTPLGLASQIERALMEIGDVVQLFGRTFLVELAQETERIHEEVETDLERTERIAEYITDNAPGNPPVSPAGVLRINDILTTGVGRRTVGWEVRGGLGFPLIVADGETRSVNAVASASLGMPISFDTQVNVTAQASSPLSEIGDRYTVGLQGDVVHTLNEIVDVGGDVKYSLHSGDDNKWSWSAGAFADVQIAKSLTLVSTAELSQADEYDQSRFEFKTSLRYRFF